MEEKAAWLVLSTDEGEGNRIKDKLSYPVWSRVCSSGHYSLMFPISGVLSQMQVDFCLLFEIGKAVDRQYNVSIRSS
jgi:hypothetical protein